MVIYGYINIKLVLSLENKEVCKESHFFDRLGHAAYNVM